MIPRSNMERSGVYVRLQRNGKWQAVDLITEATTDEFLDWARSKGVPREILRAMKETMENPGVIALGTNATWSLRVSFLDDLVKKGVTIYRGTEEWDAFRKNL